MMRRLLLGLLALAVGFAAPAAQAAGMWTLSYSQRHDLNGKPYPGAKAYFYDASTGDPITVYREYSLATPLTNPVEADGNGVFPGVFISSDETFFRFKVTTAAGVTLTDDSTVPNLSPNDGGEDPAEPVAVSAIFKTGDLKQRYDEGIHEGWLPFNGRTFGSSTSGADYASDDTEALFLFLWAKSSAAVVGGAGASAAADWAANKRYTLPDARGRVLAGLDDMDSSAAGVLPGLDVLGEIAGDDEGVLTEAQIPQLSGTTSSDGEHGHRLYGGTGTSQDAFGMDDASGLGGAGAGGSTYQTVVNGQPAVEDDGDHDHTITLGALSPTAVSRLQPSMGVSIYIKK